MCHILLTLPKQAMSHTHAVASQPSLCKSPFGKQGDYSMQAEGVGRGGRGGGSEQGWRLPPCTASSQTDPSPASAAGQKLRHDHLPRQHQGSAGGRTPSASPQGTLQPPLPPALPVTPAQACLTIPGTD